MEKHEFCIADASLFEMLHQGAMDLNKEIAASDKDRDLYFELKSAGYGEDVLEKIKDKAKKSHLKLENSVSNYVDSIKKASLQKKIDPKQCLKELERFHKRYVDNSRLKLMQLSQSIDVCFVLDATGSMHMDDIFKGLKRNVNYFIKLKMLNAYLNLRLSVVAYRDICDGDDHFKVLHFTENMKEFSSFVSSITCEGGGDECEDVVGALNEAAKLNWKNCTKLIFLCGDAPCHGSEYHDRCDDHYPAGTDLKSFEVIQDLLQKKISVVFWKVNETTDKMISKFNSEAQEIATEQHAPLISVKDLDLTNPGTITSSISDSIMNTTSSTLSKTSAIAKAAKFPEIDNALVASGNVLETLYANGKRY